MAVYNKPILPVRSQDSESATFSQRRFGGPIEVLEYTFQFSPDPAARILPNNARRLAWRITNTDRNYCQIQHENSFQSWVSVSGAYRPYRFIAPIIFPEGGSASSNVEDDGESVMQEVWVHGISGITYILFVEEIQSA